MDDLVPEPGRQVEPRAAPGGVRRVLEVVLVVGSFVAASVLGGLAVASGPAAGGSGPPEAPNGASGSLRDADQIIGCLQGGSDYVVVAPELSAPPGGEVLSVELLETGARVSLFVFATEAEADEYEDEFVGSGPIQTLIVLIRNVLIVYPDEPSDAARSSIEGCVVGAPVD